MKITKEIVEQELEKIFQDMPDIPVYKMVIYEQEETGVKNIFFTDTPDCGMMGVTFDKKPNKEL